MQEHCEGESAYGAICTRPLVIGIGRAAVRVCLRVSVDVGERERRGGARRRRGGRELAERLPRPRLLVRLARRARVHGEEARARHVLHRAVCSALLS